MKDTSAATFSSDVLGNPNPVLVDVWAPWCGPCRGMEPIIEQLASELGGKTDVYKLNADDNMEIAQQYGVSGLPTFLMFKSGQVVDSHVGATTKATLTEMIEKAA